MKIEFSQLVGGKTNIIGTAQLRGGKFLCTGKAEKVMDIMLGGKRDIESLKRALHTAPKIFISEGLKAEQIGD